MIRYVSSGSCRAPYTPTFGGWVKNVKIDISKAGEKKEKHMNACRYLLRKGLERSSPPNTRQMAQLLLPHMRTSAHPPMLLSSLT